MKISIALCTYNGERYLLEQLKSIASQTLKPDELIVSDDKSADKTLDILYLFKEICLFPMYIYENESKLGTMRNFEKIIQLCEGEIIVLSDQDDIWKPDKLEKISAEFEKSPDIGYVFSDAELVDEQLTHIQRRLWKSLGFQGVRYRQFVRGDQFSCLFRRNIVTGATMAFRSSLKNLILPFPLDTAWLHDGWIAIIASSAGMYGRPLPEPLVLYRQHSGQQIGAPRKASILKIFNPSYIFKILKLHLEQMCEAEERSYPVLKERLTFIETKIGLKTKPVLTLLEKRTVKPMIVQFYKKLTKTTPYKKP
jgi:glycosyltransferase involved in cell wall biosynthesis